MNLKDRALRLHWLLSAQFGIAPGLALRSLRGLPRYIRDLFRFRSGYAGRFELVPCLHDWDEEAGATKLEYFWQDLLVARMIHDAKPQKHVDVGSQIDGFVAHVASFREIEVFDIRPISANIPGVAFKQADFMQPQEAMSDYCDSLSCLHALEHFGLGRYGDPIDPEGAERGLANMAGLLRENGIFYLSVPIGLSRVEFNANRVFDPRAVVDMARENSLRLTALTVIRRGGLVKQCEPSAVQLAELAGERYALGLFVFELIS